jgi:hypothetical protein
MIPQISASSSCLPMSLIPFSSLNRLFSCRSRRLGPGSRAVLTPPPATADDAPASHAGTVDGSGSSPLTRSYGADCAKRTQFSPAPAGGARRNKANPAAPTPAMAGRRTLSSHLRVSRLYWVVTGNRRLQWKGVDHDRDQVSAKPQSENHLSAAHVCLGIGKDKRYGPAVLG